jgi:DNA polymerase III delta subunit
MDVKVFDLVQAKQFDQYNVFYLADALGKRERKNFWVALMEAFLRKVPGEEIAGILFWQVKSMFLAKNSQGAKEAGLSPFVFMKSRKYAEKFSDKEIKDLSSRLIGLYHDAHSGKVDMETALEKLALTI